ncbi:hypothetical protein ACWDKQ_17510 [Saccharopolyspora sp. NPDC000995]
MWPLSEALWSHGFKIEEPGPAPADPKPLPTGRPATPEETQQHAAAVEAQRAFDRKAQAYAEASQIVKDARDKESQSQHVLVRFLSGVFDPAKLSLTLIGSFEETSAGHPKAA